jgi:hypothetical protein
VVASETSVRAWEGAYRHYGRAWEWTARSPKGDPAAAREMALAVLGGGGGVAADRGRHHFAVVDVGGHRVRRSGIRVSSPQLGSTRHQRQRAMTMNKATESDRIGFAADGGETECVFLIKKGVMMDWRSYYTDGPSKGCHKAIPATCGMHRGPVGFANLLVSMQNGSIVFDPHVTGACVIALDEECATALRNLLTEWLG